MMRKFSCLTMLFVFLFPFTVFAGGTFVYDANGNLIKDNDKTYEYNQANKLVRVRQGVSGTGPVLAEYFYDFNGQRVKKIENGVTTYYIGKHYEEEYTAGAQSGKANYYFANGQRIAKKDGAGKLSFFHADHLGGTNAVSDPNGNLVERTKYYPFGDIRQGGEKDRYSFTGKEKDKATDFYYFEARYYNPGYRHFTQADVIVPNAYDPQSLNRYAYVMNNPVKYTDPSGYSDEDSNTDVDPSGKDNSGENKPFLTKMRQKWEDYNYELWTGLKPPPREQQVATNQEELKQQEINNRKIQFVNSEINKDLKEKQKNIALATANTELALINIYRGKPLLALSAVTRNFAILSKTAECPVLVTNSLQTAAIIMTQKHYWKENTNIVILIQFWFYLACFLPDTPAGKNHPFLA